MREAKRFYQFGSVAERPEWIYQDPDYETRKNEQERKHKNAQRSRKRANKKAMRASKLSAMLISVFTLMIGTMLFGLVYFQNEINSTESSITRLEDEIARVNTLNYAKKSRIDTSINLNQIREKAMNEMGMVNALENHVFYYDVADEDYMKLY